MACSLNFARSASTWEQKGKFYSDLEYLIAILGAALAGAINTLAGNGSAITLTILTELLGLPANLANGTNRIGIALQTVGASWVFYRNGKLDVRRDAVPIASITAGSVIGAWVATIVSNEEFKEVFSYLMVVMLLVLLVKPARWLRDTDISYHLPRWISLPAFLALGFYGGFIQMGMGIFFLAVMVLAARYSLLDANVLKSLVVGIYTVLIILIFQWKGMIDWRIGTLMAIGQLTGGWLTAHYASNSPKVNKWAYRILVVIVLLAVSKLFGWHTYIWAHM